MLGLGKTLGHRQLLIGGLVGLHIAAAILIEFLVEDAEVDIAGDALETTVEQRLAHDVEFLGEGVDDGDAAVGGEVGVVLIVFALGQRVVHNLAEAVVGEVVAHGVLQLARVGLLAVAEAAVDSLADMDVVVAVDTHDFLHDVALAGDVGLAGGHLEGHALGGLVDNLDVERGEGGADSLQRDVLTHEVEHAAEVHLNDGFLDGLRVEVHHLAADLAAGEFLDELHGAAQGPLGDVGVAGALVAVAGVGLQCVALAGLADAHGVEEGALEEDILCLHGGSALQATEDTGDAHAFLLITDHQVAGVEGALHAVEGDELGALRQALHDDMAAGNLVGVEGVQRLAHLHHDEVGHIHHIVDGAQTHGAQAVLQPLGALPYLHIAQRDAGIARAEVGLLDCHLNGLAGGFGGEVGDHLRPLNLQLFALAGVADSHHVAGHADVRDGIHAVGGDGHLEQAVVLHVEILLGGHSHRGVVGQHHDAGVVGTELQLVGSAEHTLADGAAQLAFLNFVVFSIRGVNLGANLGTHHLLSGRHIGGAADDVQRTLAAHIDGRQVQVVAVGVRLAGQHLRNHHMLQTTLDGLHFFHAVHLQAGESQQVVQFLRIHILNIYILFKPIKRNIHICISLLSIKYTLCNNLQRYRKSSILSKKISNS